MSVRPTLRLRLTLVYGGLFMVAGVVLLGVTYLLFNSELSASAPRLLTQKSLQQPPQFGVPEKGLPTGQAAPTPEAGSGGEDLRFAVVTMPDGTTVTGKEAVGLIAEQQDGIHRAATASLLTQGGIALGLVGVVAGGFGWLVSGRALGPLHRVTETARRIAAAPADGRGLHERIALDGPNDEVKELADTFDTMIERLDHSFDGQRRFVGNASHELRTPLTVGRALVEVAMHRRGASADVQQLGESLLQINARHERLINGLLVLARSDREVTDRSEVDLADVVAHVAGQLVAEAEDAGVELIEDAGPAPTRGDGLLLERLVHNLVENGIRHNVDGADGWVRVRSRTRTDGQVEVEVHNTGPSIPPYDIPWLFEPFHRMDSDRPGPTKGAGLGLSIVRSIANAHGGEVSAHPRDGGGLTVTALLPERSRTVTERGGK